MPRQITTVLSFPRLPHTLPRLPLKSTTFLVRQAPPWSHPRSCTLWFICLMIESSTAATCFFLSGLWSSLYFNFLWKKSVLGLTNVSFQEFSVWWSFVLNWERKASSVTSSGDPSQEPGAAPEHASSSPCGGWQHTNWDMLFGRHMSVRGIKTWAKYFYKTTR